MLDDNTIYLSHNSHSTLSPVTFLTDFVYGQYSSIFSLYKPRKGFSLPFLNFTTPYFVCKTASGESRQVIVAQTETKLIPAKLS